jgi:disulfide oxidoreductase YuzD
VSLQQQCVVRTERLVFEEVLGEEIKQVVVRAIMDLTQMGKLPVAQVIDVIANAKITKHRVVDNRKVIFEGEVEIKVIYEADVPGQPVFVAHITVPFSDFVDIEGAMPPISVFLSVTIEDVSAEIIKPDAMRATKIAATVVLAVRVRVVRRRELEVVVDVTGPPELVVETDLLRVRSLVGEGSRQIALRETVNLKQLGKPAAEQIIDAVGRINITQTRVIENKILFEGNIEVKILYASKSQQVMVVAQTLPFRDFVEVRGARPGMDVEVDVQIEHISVVAEDRDNCGEKETIVKTIILDATARVFERREIRVVTNVTGVPGIQVERALVRAEEVIGEGMEQVVISERLNPAQEDKPCAQQVIDCRAFTRIRKIEVIENKVIIDGSVDLKAIYESKAQAAHAIGGTFGFTSFVHLPGARPGMIVNVNMRVVDASCQIPSGLSAEEMVCPPIVVSAVVELTARAIASREINVVLSVVCPGETVTVVCPGVITGNNVNIRSGPGTTFPVIAQGNWGDKVTILQELNDWRKVRLSDGREGYIFHLYVRCVTPMG